MTGPDHPTMEIQPTTQAEGESDGNNNREGGEGVRLKRDVPLSHLC